MGGGQPFMYAGKAPVQYSALEPGFNPKAVTQASYAPPPPPKPKQEGPLINFNRHPDSYIVQPYGQLDCAPMSPNTKSRIKWTRGIQLASRILQLLGGLAMLIFVISIKGATDNEGWIIRLPVAIDTFTTVYAVYHLLHRVNGRTPASSASYHFFALLIDTGLVPFYVFITWVGKTNYEEAPGTDGRWRTLFKGDIATTNVLHAVWLTAIIVGSLHIISFFMDIYLLVTFKRISQMPPDMNPLEDNLTSRRKTKHKYKNSSVSDFDDKRFSQVTTNSMNTSSTNRMSRVQEPLMGQSNSSGLGFLQSRTAQDTSFSPHNPDTARLSRVSLADTYPASRIRSAMPSDTISMGKRSSIAMSSPITVRQDEAEHLYGDQVSEADDGDNWRVLDEDQNSVSDYDPYRAKSLRHTPQVDSEGKSRYEPLTQSNDNFVQQQQQPLRMNPPTPPPPSSPLHMNSPLSQLSRRYQEHDKENDRTHTMVSDVSALSMSSRYSENDTMVSAAPTSSSADNASKSRFYGDLAAAMRGVRQNGVPAPRPKSMIGSVHNAGSDISSLRPSPQRGSRQSPASGRARPRSYVDSVSGTVIRKPAEGLDGERGSPRVVSRSGVDYGAEGDLGLGRSRRDVSGKVVEEGRGGYVRTGLFMRKASGMS